MEIFSSVGKNIKLKALYYCLGLVLLLMGSFCFAEDKIVIGPNTVINQAKTYKNVTLDMSNGWFYITNNATLTLESCKVVGTLSPANPVLFNVDAGKLVMQSNHVAITALNIEPHPTTQSLQHVIQIALGNVELKANNFTINKAFSAGLLITTASIPTTGFQITDNTFEQFHGVLYLLASSEALIKDNKFLMNTYGNIVNIGNNNNIIHNTIYFSGSNHLGNSIDIIDSDHVLLSRNILLTPTCHGIYILNSSDLTIDSNRVYGGITYAMNVLSFPELPPADGCLKQILANYKLKSSISSRVTITNNYLAQNRYGIAASDVDGLTVSNNYFIQSFDTSEARKFWTDNSVLLTQVTNLIWTNNLYKEAYSQDPLGTNNQSKSFVPFPVTGGVVL